MASIKSFLDWVKGEDMEDDFDDFTPVQREEPIEEDAQQSTSSSYSAPSSAGSSRKGNVVNINATAQLAVVLVKPDRFENAAEIADHLKEKRTVVLNLEQTNKDVARRLVDFLSGVAYANEGKIKKVANSTFIITPYNVDILGDLIDELESNGLYI
ncbi:MAG: cell division protein SepF [Clostridiales bacterium]|nr:cell division protein SepF [Butyricicoccus pullicaecorum]MCI6720740.1 cell division protein SepF [Clostridiales bacterium]